MDQTVGIVGARRCSQEAKQKTVFLASEYAKTQIAVVSGMAKGIDSYAHTACLNAGGYTIRLLLYLARFAPAPRSLLWISIL